MASLNFLDDSFPLSLSKVVSCLVIPFMRFDRAYRKVRQACHESIEALTTSVFPGRYTSKATGHERE